MAGPEGDVGDPWELYDDLIDAIPGKVTVTSGSAGLRWAQIISSDGGLGIAYTIDEQSRPLLYSQPNYVGARLRDIAALAKSWNFAEAAVGMAAINAWYAEPQRASADGFAPCACNAWGQLFAPYADAVAGKVVTVIGHFPFAPSALGRAADVRMLERRTQPGDYPDPACEYLLGESDYAFISSSAFVNKTMPRLLQLARSATTVVVGPSTPLSTTLFAHGADAVTGYVSTSPSDTSDSLGGLNLTGMFAHGYRVEQTRA